MIYSVFLLSRTGFFMKTKLVFLALSTFWLIFTNALPLVAQESTEAQAETEQTAEELAPGHSAHGEAFNEGPRQSASILGGTGPIHFGVTSDHPEVQQYVEQGIGQLHGFWYFEAERSFRQAAMLDPDCAICYWGMAMANYSNKKRAKEFLVEALERRDKASEREVMYIDALDDWLNGKGKPKEKAKRQVESFEKIVEKYPEDLEAKAWLSYTLYKQRGSLGKKHEEVDEAIHKVLAAEPLHPVHHYRIHLWDYKNSKLALDSATKCGATSPRIAHMWHMPGHIYSRLNRYQDAVWQQEASARTDHSNMMRDRVMPDEIHNFAHNNEWLIRNLIYVGRWKDALDLAKNMIELPRHPKYNTLSKRNSSYYGRIRLLDVLKHYELWAELIALTESAYLEPSEDLAQQIRRLEHRGIAFAHLHHTDQVAHIIEDLTARIQTEKDKAAEAQRKHQEAVAKAKEDGKKTPKKPSDKTATLIKQIEKAVASIQGRLLLEYGDYSEAVVKLTKADDDKSTLAYARLLAGERTAALKAIEDEVSNRKNQVLPLARKIEMLWMAGESMKAKEAFEQLRNLSGSLQLGVVPFERLSPIAEQLGLPSDWRVTFKHPEDFGDRPDLDSLGPFRWSPTSAPDWKLKDHTGKEITLAQYRGQPVLVIFYLGYGCLHCAEQLQAFAPKVEDFKKASIAMVGISTDDLEGLKVSVDTYEGGMPFPLLSNDALDVFKEYRAHDDFENSPLHGTFLIDGNGRVVWQDIGYEPFMDVDFVLEESQRLLQQEQPLSPLLDLADLPEKRPSLLSIPLDDLPRIDPIGVVGSLIIAGEELPDEAIDTFFRLAHGEKSKAVLLILDNEQSTQATTQRLVSHSDTIDGAELRLVRLNGKNSIANTDWTQLLTDATGLWIAGGREESFQQLAQNDVARIALHNFVEQKKVIGANEHGGAIFADKTFVGETSDLIGDGTLALLPESLIDLQASQQESPSRIEHALQIQRHRIGFEIPRNAAMIVRGRRISKVGEGTVRVRRFAGDEESIAEIDLESDSDVVDLIALRRAARDGMSGYPAQTSPRPTKVNKGTLILIGGGGMPKGIINRFVELAGGKKAKIVVLPTAMPDPLSRKSGIGEEFTKLGAEKVTVLSDRTLEKVESTEFLKTLNEATGIWFGGGRQWRFVDAYLDTKAHTAMNGVINRGGVIMGSSAGASIQAEFLARGNPLANLDIMADGYQKGLGFLPGVAVDQHFTQRNRQADMLSLVTRHPAWLGIGIDESTALIVKGEVGEVVGNSKVHFYDASQGVSDGFTPVEVGDGDHYHLIRRKLVDPPQPPEEKKTPEEKAE